MVADKQTENPATELSLLAREIDGATGGSFDAESPAASELDSDGAWAYHFQTDERWGFVAAAPDTSAETTYSGWGTITVKPDHCAVFFDGDLAGIVSPYGGRIGGYAVATRDENVGELEDAMVTAFRAEYDALTTGTADWKPALASRTEG
jgi:hypothetical protein